MIGCQTGTLAAGKRAHSAYGWLGNCASACDNPAMQIATIADITPNGTATVLAGVTTRAIYVAMTASGSSIRTGDSHVGASRGVALPSGAFTVPYPRQDNEQQPYDLSQIYVYGASGTDKVSITYGF
jgi:hypothetical protein